MKTRALGIVVESPQPDEGVRGLAANSPVRRGGERPKNYSRLYHYFTEICEIK